MTTVAYAMAAVRMVGKGALIQQSNAVESASHVTLLCLDKTGTLTTNRITLQEICPLVTDGQNGNATLKRLMGDFATSISSANRTIEAIRLACGGTTFSLHQEVPFSSKRGWSALAFADSARPGVYFLGAPEMLGPFLVSPDELPPIEGWTRQGLRVLLFAHHPQPLPLDKPHDEPRLPAGLIPLALLVLRDELRPEARETLRHFGALGIDLKIISGDNPLAVASLARQVGMVGNLRTLSGLEMDTMDDAQLEEVAKETTVFGRITPQQKERTVGIPILAIAIWARPAPPQWVIQSASHFVIPASLTIAIVALAIYMAYLAMSGDVDLARTALTIASLLCGLVLILFVEPPTRAWVGGDAFSGDWRPTVLALGLNGFATRS